MRRLILFLPLFLLSAAPHPPVLRPIDRMLAEGVIHRLVVTERGEVLNILLLSLRNGAPILGVQGEERYSGIEDLRAIYDRNLRDRTNTRVLAAVNAGSWRNDRPTPVGPRIVGGEIVDIEGFHGWPSLVISSSGRAAISLVTLSARISWKYRTIPVENINRRATSSGIVLYNRFAGQSIPSTARLDDRALEHAIRAQMALEGEGSDDLDTAAMLRDLRISTRDRGLENGTMKLVCVPIGSGRDVGPTPGVPIPMLIRKITSDTVAVPPNGYVISLGSARDMFTYASVGDTIRLLLQAGSVGEPGRGLPPGGISELLTGTPRLIRDGQIETFDAGDGIHPDRFFTGELARTAAGTTLAGDTLMLVTVDPPDPAKSRPGVTIARLAELMHSLGAWDALNLESGPASAMVIEGVPVGTVTGRELASSAFVILTRK